MVTIVTMARGEESDWIREFALRDPSALPEFASRLAWAIAVSGKTPTRVQREAGLQQGYIFKLLGRSKAKQIVSPGPDVIRPLADCLQVAYEWLAIGRGPVRPTGWGTTQLDSAAALALASGCRQDAIDAAVARYRDDMATMTGTDWILAFNAEALRLDRAGVPRPEVVQETQRKLSRLTRTRNAQLEEIADLQKRIAELEERTMGRTSDDGVPTKPRAPRKS